MVRVGGPRVSHGTITVNSVCGTVISVGGYIRVSGASGVRPGVGSVRSGSSGRSPASGRFPWGCLIISNFNIRQNIPFSTTEMPLAGSGTPRTAREKTSERRGPGGRDRQRQPTSPVRRVVPARAGVGGAGRDSLWRSRGCRLWLERLAILEICGQVVRGWGSRTVKAIICTHSIRMHTSYVLTLPPTHRHRIGPVRALHVLPHCRAPQCGPQLVAARPNRARPPRPACGRAATAAGPLFTGRRLDLARRRRAPPRWPGGGSRAPPLRSSSSSTRRGTQSR